jgi:RNA polymerase sigma factor (sigma-70 family)
MGLVHAVVNQQWIAKYQHSGVTKDELVQEGSLGLLRAAALFDPSRGLRFSTYAVIWIKGTLSNQNTRME